MNVEYELQTGTQRKLLVVHSDGELAQILAAEIEAAVERPVSSAGFEDASAHLAADTCLLMTTACELKAINQLPPAQYRVIRLNSVEDEVARTPGAFVGLVNRGGFALAVYPGLVMEAAVRRSACRAWTSCNGTPECLIGAKD